MKPVDKIVYKNVDHIIEREIKVPKYIEVEVIIENEVIKEVPVCIEIQTELDCELEAEFDGCTYNYSI